MKIHKLEYSYDKNDRISVSKDVKDIPGVYILYDKDLKVIYIGESKNVRSRITAHISKNNSGRNENPIKGDYGFNTYLPLNVITHYSSIEIETITERQMVESFLINYFQPKFNRVCSFCENKATKKEEFNT